MPWWLVSWNGENKKRSALLSEALFLSYFSVAFGLIAGATSITAGLLAGSLGVLGLGLNVIADVAGSVGLIWRFRVEKQDPDRAQRAEARASLIVAVALFIISITLTIEAVTQLAAGTTAQKSVFAMVSAGISALVLAPLGAAKHRVGKALRSHALRGDGTLSAIGAALGVTALLGLLAEELLGWWWADRCAALLVAVVAGAEAARVITRRPDL